MTIEYDNQRIIESGAFVEILRRSGLSERRPVDDAACIKSMLDHGNLLCTAWDGDKLVGVARSVTDFSYCCYLSDLAVDKAYQKQGIGKGLIRATRASLGPGAILILLAAPAARGYYPQIGFERHDSAWILRPGQPF